MVTGVEIKGKVKYAIRRYDNYEPLHPADGKISEVEFICHDLDIAETQVLEFLDHELAIADRGHSWVGGTSAFGQVVSTITVDSILTYIIYKDPPLYILS